MTLEKAWSWSVFFYLLYKRWKTNTPFDINISNRFGFSVPFWRLSAIKHSEVSDKFHNRTKFKKLSEHRFWHLKAHLARLPPHYICCLELAPPVVAQQAWDLMETHIIKCGFWRKINMKADRCWLQLCSKSKNMCELWAEMGVHLPTFKLGLK